MLLSCIYVCNCVSVSVVCTCYYHVFMNKLMVYVCLMCEVLISEMCDDN